MKVDQEHQTALLARATAPASRTMLESAEETSQGGRYLRDVLVSGLRSHLEAVSVSIDRAGRPIAVLSRDFVADRITTDALASLPLRQHHLSVGGVADRGDTSVRVRWLNRLGDEISVELCRCFPTSDATCAMPRRLPRLLASGSERGQILATVEVGETLETISVLLDGMVIGWFDIPPEQVSEGSPLRMSFPVPASLLDRAQRPVFFTGDGVQLVHVEPAQRPLPAWVGGLGKRFALTSPGMLDTVVLDPAKAASTSTTLVIYAIHTKRPTLSLVHRTVIGEFKKRGAVVVLVNSYQANASDLAADAGGADLLISRSEYGRDFASWCSTFELYSEWIMSFERTIFANDSLVGPLTGTTRMFDFFSSTSADLSALTDSYHFEYHLQSSIFQIRKAAWTNATFRSFFRDYAYPDERALVVAEGELGLTRAALNAGISLDVMCPYHAVAERWLQRMPRLVSRFEELPEFRVQGGVQGGFLPWFRQWLFTIAGDIRSGIPRNPQHTFWDVILGDFGYPFIKRDILLHNPEALPNLFLLHELFDPDYGKLGRAMLHEAGLKTTRTYGAPLPA